MQRSSILSTALAIALAGLAVAYMARTVLLVPEVPPHGIDFAYIWAAGQIWAAGGNPYAASFGALAADLPGIDEELHRWAYAPHAWPIARALAALPLETARALWGWLSVASLAGAVALCVAASPGRRSLLIGAGVLLYAATAFPTVLALLSGQYTMLLFAGLALFLYGFVRDRPACLVAGLVLLALKPSVGVPFAALAAFRSIASVLAAIGIAAVLAAPALAASGLADVVRGYLGAVAAYGGYPPNAPRELTGLTALVWHATAAELSPVLLLAVTLALLSAAAIRLGPRLERAETRADLAGFAVIATLSVMPFHVYDLTLVVALVVMSRDRIAAAAVLLLWLALFRVLILADLLGWADLDDRFQGTFTASVALVAAFAALGARVVLKHRTRPPPGERPGYR